MTLLSDEAYLQCIRCGLCLAVCPSYRTTLNETDSPRGRVALVRAQTEGRLAHSANYADKFFRCLLCEACENICPVGIEHSQLLYDGLNEAGANVELVQVENAGHGFRPIGEGPKPTHRQLQKKVLEFFDQHLSASH